jgi:hypothetical protein
MLTADPALLLAFVYFDQLHAGYLLDKDVEDLLNIIGLQLSRAQVSVGKQRACFAVLRQLLSVIRRTRFVVLESLSQTTETC